MNSFGRTACFTTAIVAVGCSALTSFDDFAATKDASSSGSEGDGSSASDGSSVGDGASAATDGAVFADARADVTADGGVDAEPVDACAPKTTGFKPGTMAVSIGAAGDWATLSNVIAVDGLPAAISLLPDGRSDELVARGFGFSIPTQGVILGMTVQVTRAASVPASISDEVSIFLDQNGTGEEKNGPGWGQTYSTVNYGGPADLWAVALTPSMVNAATFGVGLHAFNDDEVTSLAQVDAILVAITYSECGAL